MTLIILLLLVLALACATSKTWRSSLSTVEAPMERPRLLSEQVFGCFVPHPVVPFKPVCREKSAISSGCEACQATVRTVKNNRNRKEANIDWQFTTETG